MKYFRIIWIRVQYAKSSVDANDENEAKEKALKNEDRGFEEFEGEESEWLIDEIVELKGENDEVPF